MPDYVMTGRECRDVDQRAMSRLNLSEFQLMQRAADAALDVLTQRWPSARHLAVYCGPGNNGGDGYLVAADAKKLGFEVTLFTLGLPASKTAQLAREKALAQGLLGVAITDETKNCIDTQADLIVDALFGHGLERDITAPLSALFKQINQSRKPVFALDMPSGINSDSGAVLGIALNAKATICFVAPKIGLLTGEGADFAGKIYYHNLGIPDNVSREIPASYTWLDDQFLKGLFPAPKASSHKGDFGHVAIVGGQPGMPGAVLLAAMAAARSGAGRVTVVSSVDHVHLFPLASPVLMTQTIGGNARFTLPDSITALALGPGLGLRVSAEQNEPRRAKISENWSREVFDYALDKAIEARLPVLLDADGLNLLAMQQRRYENWVLSPHPKEAAGLLGCRVAEIQSNRPVACQRIAEQYGGVCVLKGKGSLVARASGKQAICTRGNWGMATAGSGDVLSGIIVAFLGQGLGLYEAACGAVYAHARAGDLAAEKVSKRSLISSDIVETLPALFRQIEADDL